jgi:polar amino acid transport system substrate-binding protein
MHTHASRRGHALLVVACVFALAAGSSAGGAQEMTPAVRSELAPSGRLRVGINFGNTLLAARDASGRPRGLAVSLAEELARRLGTPIDIVPFESAGRMADAVSGGAWDVAFLGADPDRAGDIAFTAPYLEIDTTYLVPSASPLRTIADVDREGVRIAVSAKSAYDLYLTRALTRAELVRAPSPNESVSLFFSDRLDALAALRPVLVDLVEQRPGYRILDGRFTVVSQAVGTPKNRTAAARALRAFVEDVKATGFVASAIKTHNVRGVSVAPPAAD